MEETLVLDITARIDKDSLSKSLDQLKKELKDAQKAMGAAPANSEEFKVAAQKVNLLSTTIKDLTNTAKQAENSLGGINKSAKVTAGSTNELRQQLKFAKEDLDNARRGSDEYNAALIKYNNLQGQYIDEQMKRKSLFQERVKAAVSEIPIVGQLTSQYDTLNETLKAAYGPIAQYVNSIKNAGSAGEAAKVATQGFGSAMKALPIVALISALATLASFFTSTAEGADMFDEVFMGIKEGFKAFVKELARSGKSLLSFFSELGSIVVETGRAIGNAATGDFAAASKALDNIKESGGRAVDALKGASISFSDLATNIKKAYNEGAEYARILDEIEDKEMVQRMNRSRDSVTIAVLEKAAKNRTLSEKERIAMLTKANEIEKRNFDVEFKNTTARLEADKKLLASRYKVDAATLTSSEVLNNLTDEDREMLIKSIEAVDNKRRESLALQEKLKVRIDTLRAEIQADEEKATAERLKREEKEAALKEKLQKEAEQKEKEYFDAQRKGLEALRDLRVEIIKDEYERSLAAAELERNRRAEEVMRSIQDEKLKAQQLELIHEAYNKKVSDINAKRVEDEKKKSEEVIRSKKAEQAATFSAINSSINAIETLGALAGKNNEFTKATALFQILANMGQAIASATAASAANPANAVTFGAAGAAQYAAMVAQIIAGIGQAIQVLTEPPKFAKGGFTGSGMGYSDETGHRVAGVVHANEYVVPAHLLRQQDVSQMVREIEMRRNGYKPVGYTESMAKRELDIIKLANMMPSQTLNIERLDSFNRKEVRIKRGAFI